jgi:hypothetical protein
MIIAGKIAGFFEATENTNAELTYENTAPGKTKITVTGA